MHVICLVATDTATLPGRVCGILARDDVDVTSMSMTRSFGEGLWRIQILGHFDSDWQLELIRKRLSRLVDVVKVNIEPDVRIQGPGAALVATR